jgi:hypothetical protein
LVGWLLLSALIFSVHAQDTPAPTPQGGAAETEAGQLSQPTVEEPTPDAKLLKTLRTLQKSIDTLQEQLTEKRNEAAEPNVPLDRQEALMAEIEEINRQIDSQQHNFEELAAGTDLGSLADGSDEAAIDLGSDMREFLAPIVSELKDLTSRPREVEALRRDAEMLRLAREKAVTALENIRHLLQALRADPDAENGEGLLMELTEFEQSWQTRLDQIDSNIEVTELQLAKLNRESKSLFGTIRGVMASFFRSRGMNLFFAVLAFATVMLVFRLGHSVLIKWSPLRKHERRSFYVRLLDVIYFSMSVTLAVLAALAVLYSAGDWVLLGLALLFLAGIAWTGKHTLPQMYDQIKLILNLGPVREGERLVYESVPWKVGQIGFYTDLTNDSLEGGRIRLPIRTLSELHSRPFGQKEPWFPSEQGHWVLLGDGVFGRVILQTPDWVEMVLLGGSRKMYTVLDFVALSPENLSRNFRVRSVFGIDYGHQEISTTEVPDLLRDHIRTGLLESSFLKDPDDLVHLAVEFSNAGASSLDYTVLADFRGSIAQNYNKIQRLIAKLCVDACNENGWVIPFTQVTLHQAVVGGDSVESESENGK